MKGTFDLVKCDENLINARLWTCKDECQCQNFHHEKLQTPDYAQFMQVHFIQTVKVAKNEFNFASPFFLKFAKYDCAVTRFLCTFYFQKWNSKLSFSFSHYLVRPLDTCVQNSKNRWKIFKSQSKLIFCVFSIMDMFSQ